MIPDSITNHGRQGWCGVREILPLIVDVILESLDDNKNIVIGVWNELKRAEQHLEAGMRRQRDVLKVVSEHECMHSNTNCRSRTPSHRTRSVSTQGCS